MIGNLSNEGGLMKEETVKRVIGEMSVGNGDLALVMDLVYRVAKKQIGEFPDDNALAMDFCKTRLVRASGKLIGQEIEAKALIQDPVGYWGREEAKKVSGALADFVTRKDLRNSGD